MKKIVSIVSIIVLSVLSVQAQITIGGNVYGGGNAGVVQGNTAVTVLEGDLNAVFGGARMADVNGTANVTVDGEHMSGDIIVNYIYGGNDITGTIAGNASVSTTPERKVTTGEGSEAVTTQPHNIFVGQMYGGGNGDYNYTAQTIGDSPNPYLGMTSPVLAQTYLDIQGGTIGHLYGGGNSATITEQTTIDVNNSSEVTTSIKDAEGNEILTTARLKRMGLNSVFTNVASDDFQFARVFGGNNKVDMDIRPTWKLKKGQIRDLYSGGNRGSMTNENGIVLVIGSNDVTVDNVYGGCRMADVHPSGAIRDWEEGDTWDGVHYKFPPGYSAKLLIDKGQIRNVYGGNDISGIVYGGNAVGVRCSISGDVYGGGNGSYPYTDNIGLRDTEEYGDYFYDVNGTTTFTGQQSVEALNRFRPNAEQVSIRLVGTEDNPTVIGGSVYCGGNSATLNISQNDVNKNAELKLGSYVIASQMFLGSNGENLVATPVLQQYKGVVSVNGRDYDFSRIDLTDSNQFATYMDAVSVGIKPKVVFDTANDGEEYQDFSSQIGSLYCGGNKGSMTYNGLVSLSFTDKIIIFDKVVGGSNDANVVAVEGLNAAYKGGVIGNPDTDGNKLVLDFKGLKIQPKRWKNEDDKSQGLEWNTISAATGENVAPVTTGTGETTAADLDRRFKGGNIYGGCYSSGHVNGNVIINIEASIIDRHILFDEVEGDDEGERKLYGNDSYNITKRNTGVILDEQGMEVLGLALNVFGGGKGHDTEIWGSTQINLKKGYVFQVFGGSEEGTIGKMASNGTWQYDDAYSTEINLMGSKAGVPKSQDMTEDVAEAEFIYGGGFAGPILGNTKVNLNNGRIFNSFAGSCNADIYGHTETFIGLNGFPYIRDYVYGGNDLGGEIKGEGSFASRIRDDASFNVAAKVYDTSKLNASAYIEYFQGRVEKIFGGCYGVYDYTDSHYRDYFDSEGHAKTGYTKPKMGNAFVNFRPGTNNSSNLTRQIYGAGQGHFLEPEENKMQQSSYLLIDIPQNYAAFQDMEIFGAGECGGVREAVIDLMRGQVKAVYGGSYKEGITGKTVVNVPQGSTVSLANIFGGAYGLIEKDAEGNDLVRNDVACDVYQANVNYHSNDATVTGAVYGGNNSCRRTLYSRVNIDKTVWSNKDNGYQATVYGAGYGENTWSQYTEVNLLDGALVYEVYGGGQNGRVLNVESVAKWKTLYPQLYTDLEDGYTDEGLESALVSAARIHTTDPSRPAHYNTNVHIYEGAYVGNYAYGGGLGNAAIDGSGDVLGTTYIDLLGGRVKKDVYAAGTRGAVRDFYGVRSGFVASANLYVEGGSARNVYGGGWAGAVGKHEGIIKSYTTDEGKTETYIDYVSTSTENDIDGETHVIIGKLDGTSYVDGIPAVERNAYGGGEGGPVFGTANITINKGYVGYRYFPDKATADADYRAFADNDRTTADPADLLAGISDGGGYYQEKIHDETWSGDGADRLYDSGCVFGGGYIDNSSVDYTNVNMYGGHVRNALFGGGEIAAIGRGVIDASGEENSIRVLQRILKAGISRVALWEGHVHRNVFGGGRGYNNLGEGGTIYYSDGYVFGQTEVRIHGGEVGTEAGVEINEEQKRGGDGNVFGGGDIGFVYSAYNNSSGDLCFGVKQGTRYDSDDHNGIVGDEGYYYRFEGGSYVRQPDGSYQLVGGNFVDEDGNPASSTGKEKILTEDCRVIIEPHCRALQDVSINGHTYSPGEYVLYDDLNTLKNKNSDAAVWNKLDPTGIIIHNAVFAGGNTSSGSASVYANTTTVFGNATAAIQDVYHRDLITLGTGHTGGLYGDGNLTFVDGFRELNITNYGTDYYSIDEEITLQQYEQLPQREAAYYELKYKCIRECTDDDGTTYHPKDEDDPNSKASTLTADDILSLFKTGKNTTGVVITDEHGKRVPNPDYWTENGVLPVYAGRLMNTIQRADFCAVFGSRMVMQGARDRVPEITDFTNYTINRVREVSLNKVISEARDNPDNNKDYIHGNYFGIYSVVNYLGALTSDVDFQDTRTTNNNNTTTYGPKYPGETYLHWKSEHVNSRIRNNGSSHNKVALASGVYLELTTEESTGNDLYQKDWGYITGIIELDLINVQTGIGGGFVYARNVHGERSSTGRTHATTTLNRQAVTNKMFTYSLNDNSKYQWQTSGNFVHSTQTIIDDCYNVSGKYKSNYNPPDGVPAHYWYIKGQVYVYDQYISAYTGAPNAYSEKVDIPLTITAASHGTMKLLNVQPNYYAFYKADGVELEPGQKLVINDVTYYKNDPIDYWTYSLLNAAEKNLFVPNTYVVKENCKIGNTSYTEGQVLTDIQYNALTHNGTVKPTVTQEYLDEEDGHTKSKTVPFDYIFRSSNNISHDTGYILTYKVNNPTAWDITDTPTYRLIADTGGEVLGQHHYNLGNIIAKSIYDTYDTNVPDEWKHRDDQALFQPASIVTSEVTIGNDTWYPGSTVTPETAALLTGHVEDAYVCTHTIQLDATDYIYLGSKMPKSEYDALIAKYGTPSTAENPNPDYNKALSDEINEELLPAYICTKEGLFGGNYYQAGKNYRALEAWASMPPADRQHFTFNYDALDVLIDPHYGGAQGRKYQYDSSAADYTGALNNPAHYSLEQSVDYTASYAPETSDATITLAGGITLKRNGVTINNVTTIQKDDELAREAFEEKLHNEQRHYAAINVEKEGLHYVVKNSFQVGNTPYAAGTSISSASYAALSSEDQGNIAKLSFESEQVGKRYYFCRETYNISTGSLGVPVSALDVYASDADNPVSGSYGKGNEVPVGAVIGQDTYSSLVDNNQQKHFIIHGIAPTETSTFYVSRNSDIFDLSQEKIISVIYQYDYDEDDEAGNITPVTERHVLNIHIKFKSGVPSLEDIKTPQIVLPGSRLVMREPDVIPGAYEVTGGGWELFQKKSDAESHDNGKPYSPLNDKLFFYQDGYYLAYYATTYLGKTYSNHVQVSVANYHDLDDVINDKLHHYYIDKTDMVRQKRGPKIYVNDATDGVTQLKDLFDLSVLDETIVNTDANGLITTVKATGEDSPLRGHALLDEQVQGCKDLDFYLHTNIKHTGDWTPIANGSNCFMGSLHGEGYYIDGLSQSLFGKLCGNVYNLGVMGSFTSAGIADTGSGFIGNSWIKSTSTSGFAADVNPVFGKPNRDAGDERGAVQLDNCYYPESNAYTGTSTNHGMATRMTDREFYNGTVAYNLNGYYLAKRFFDHQGSGPYTYNYLVDETDGEGNAQLALKKDGKYSADYSAYVYVEDRYRFPDFIYANGTIPESDDIRLRPAEESDTVQPFYAPIWPDDYLFFGQMLTYNWSDTRLHQDVPSHIAKSGSRLSNTDTNNRVFRAPAYYRDSKLDVAHFNPDANLVAYSKPKGASDSELMAAYPGMTAIDFKGHNDKAFQRDFVSVEGRTGKVFCPPLLDDWGLQSIINRDETDNLLVYVPASAVNVKTYEVLNENFTEPAFDDLFSGEPYNSVAVESNSSISGHLVQSSLQARGDHLLVDRQDFNCPIAYTFVDDYRMWYQRLSGDNEFVNMKNGWQGISLPFPVEITTTQSKGELTHFYAGSTTGHEYWLRRFGGTLTPKAGSEGVYEADFGLLPAGNNTKEYTNTYLWDTYYSRDEYQDRNTDSYQQNYYQNSHTYDDYPYLREGTPYLLGLPGATYYEFDLSGQWTPSNRYQNVTIPNPGRQVVTFASPVNTSIGVSDSEIGVAPSGISFRPSYLNTTFAADAVDAFTLSATGASYDQVSAEVTVPAFRPYFYRNGSAAARGLQQIVFSDVTNIPSVPYNEENSGEAADGKLIIKTGKKIISVESTYNRPMPVTIHSTSGITLAAFTIEPGQTVETRTATAGVYIVNRKKVTVR